jgi:hypothetical protein
MSSTTTFRRSSWQKRNYVTLSRSRELAERLPAYAASIA